MKVALPSDIVSGMDTYINSSSSYSGRQDFVADAIANLLADVQAAEEEAEEQVVRDVSAVTARTSQSAVGAANSVGSKQLPSRSTSAGDSENLYAVEHLDRSTALALSAVAFPIDHGLLALAPTGEPRSEPTWGMHNRDFPTLWAAGLLSRELSGKESISYHPWRIDTTVLAWRVAAALEGSSIDMSGFPMNRRKAEKSEGRFVRFFLGDEPGSGPLFELGLVADLGDDQVAITGAGNSLLLDLEGWAPAVDERTDETYRLPFLYHLARYVPADFALLRQIVTLIDSGIDNREPLVAEVSSLYPNWSQNVSATNVQGFIGRARQWGLILWQQENRRYLLAPEAKDELEEIQADSDEESV